MDTQPESAVQKNIIGTASKLRVSRIRELNDAFRLSFSGGQIMLTDGVRGLGPDSVAAVLKLVRAFNEFGPGCDPYQEHDFGSVRYGHKQLFWKIDYYDTALLSGSPDPAEPSVTMRVMTIMLASEY